MILRMLEAGPVTQRDAIFAAGCYRLAARIADLKADGIDIESEMVTYNGTRFARYRLAVPKSEQLTVGL